MSLSLPLMNNLCKRWSLPPHIIQNCDFYFLKNVDDPAFVQLLEVELEEDQTSYFFIEEYAIRFRVIFQHDSLEVYRKNGEADKRNEPNNTKYWLSFRSITFNHNGKDCTRSYVLVQVDKGQKKESNQELDGGRGAAPDHVNGNGNTNPKVYNPKQIKMFNSFADKSQPKEHEIDEEV